ncbi:Inorganic phosphate transporter, partial [Globisporangium polare]
RPFGEIDAEFYEKLNGADDFTRESFTSASKPADLEKNATPGAYVVSASPN